MGNRTTHFPLCDSSSTGGVDFANGNLIVDNDIFGILGQSPKTKVQIDIDRMSHERTFETRADVNSTCLVPEPRRQSQRRQSLEKESPKVCLRGFDALMASPATKEPKATSGAPVAGTLPSSVSRARPPWARLPRCFSMSNKFTRRRIGRPRQHNFEAGPFSFVFGRTGAATKNASFDSAPLA